ncbi:MAG: SRPBCC family protein [Bdellovibrionota bacterium]
MKPFKNAFPRLAAVGAFFLLLASCASKSVPATEIPENLPDFDQRLLSGKIFTSALPIEGSPARLGKVIGMIDAPPDIVWKVVTRYEDYVNYMPLVVQSKVTPLGPTTCKLYQKYQLKLGSVNFGKVIPVSYWVELRMNHDARLFHIDWDMLGGDIVNTYGSWDLLPFGPGGKKTKLTYQLYFEVGNPLMDQSAKFLDEEVLPLVITSIREKVKDPGLATLTLPPYAVPPKQRSLEQDVEKAFEGVDLR